VWVSTHSDFPGPANRVQFVTHQAKLIEQHAGSGADWPTGHHTVPDVLLWTDSGTESSLNSRDYERTCWGHHMDAIFGTSFWSLKPEMWYLLN
jgi:hypothetical protein